MPNNKKENIYLLTDKGVELTPIIIELSLWGNRNMKDFNHLDHIEALDLKKSIIIDSVHDSYLTMANNLKQDTISK